MAEPTAPSHAETLARIGDLMRASYDEDWETVREKLTILHTPVLRAVGRALWELDAAIAVELDRRG